MDRKLYHKIERARDKLVIGVTGLQYDPSWMYPIKHSLTHRLEFSREALAILEHILMEEDIEEDLRGFGVTPKKGGKEQQ